MKRCCIVAFALGMSLLIAGCSETPPAATDTRAADEKAIRDGENAWNADFKSRDVDRLVNHYADDAVLMVPGEHLAKGKDAIRAALTETLKDRNFATSCSNTTVVVAKSSDIAYSQGTCSTTMSNRKTGKPVNEKDNYLTVYSKQVGGFWKAVQDIVTPDAPPPAPVAPVKKAKAKAARHRR